MSKRVLVTGGAGFIGRNLVRLLVNKAYQVTILDNLALDEHNYLPENMHSQVITVEGDTTDINLVDKLVKEQEAVVHLADPPSFLMYEKEPVKSTVATVHGFLNILEAIRKHGIRKIVYASTSTVYKGNPPPYVEDMPLEPPDLKSLSKKMKEEIAKQYSARFGGFTAIGLRPFTAYGGDEYTKGGYASVVSLFVWTMLQGNKPVVWGDGNQTRDYIFIDDVARAFLMALERDIDTQVFNVGTGISASFNQVIRIINEQLGTNLQPNYVSVPTPTYAYHMLADTTRAERILGFKPEVGLREGIGRVIDYAKEIISQNPDLGAAQLHFEKLANQGG